MMESINKNSNMMIGGILLAILFIAIIIILIWSFNDNGNNNNNGGNTGTNNVDIDIEKSSKPPTFENLTDFDKLKKQKIDSKDFESPSVTSGIGSDKNTSKDFHKYNNSYSSSSRSFETPKNKAPTTSDCDSDFPKTHHKDLTSDSDFEES